MSTPKAPPAVAAAVQLVSDKKAELGAAHEDVKRLEKEYGEALDGARQAQQDADAALPQCRRVTVSRFSGRESNECRVVILRKTPSGMLVVRRVGDYDGYEFKFKVNRYSGEYVQAEKTYGYSSDSSELRDVPAEYMPAEEAQSK